MKDRKMYRWNGCEWIPEADYDRKKNDYEKGCTTRKYGSIEIFGQGDGKEAKTFRWTGTNWITEEQFK